MKILIVLPAYNEEKIIRQNITRLHSYMEKHFSGYAWNIVISDNNSKDTTKDIVLDMAISHARLKYFFVPEKGKGVAIRRAWEAYDADTYCFMDADLSTDIEALPLLIGAIEKDGYDVACGSRFHRDSHVERSLVRKTVSFAYHILAFLVFQLKIKDLPCGFKAINNKIKTEIVPLVENNEWFFDSEMVILSEKSGYRIKEIPVHWTETIDVTRKSQVKVISLGIEYFKKIILLKKRLKNIEY